MGIELQVEKQTAQLVGTNPNLGLIDHIHQMITHHLQLEIIFHTVIIIVLMENIAKKLAELIEV